MRHLCSDGPRLVKGEQLEKVEELKGWISDFLGEIASGAGHFTFQVLWQSQAAYTQRRRGTKVVRPSSVILG
jgi:hypothetical protein